MVTPVHTKVPGRARFKVEGLSGSDTLKAFLESRLPEHEEILRASASSLTGNILVSYNSNNDPEKIQHLINRIFDQAPHRTANSGQTRYARPKPKAEKKTAARSTGSTNPSAFSKISRALGMRSKAEEEFRWHILSVKKTLLQQGTDPGSGLSLAEAKTRLADFGLNRLPEPESRSGLAIFIKQIQSFPVCLLGAAAGVSVLTGGLLDAAVIMGVVIANGVIGYWTESRAEKTIRSLKNMVQPFAEVIREGKSDTIAVQEVVPGDILVLKPGTYVAADSRILQSVRLTIDESMLTGESLPVEKHARPLRRPNTPLTARRNMAFMGTLVTGGEGLAIAVSTGNRTEIGKLQLLLTDTEAPRTPIERQLEEMGDQLVLLCIGVCGMVFGIGFLRGYGFLHMLRTSISLAASAVPEGLPAAATINFAMGITRMREHRVLIRNLHAVETLGAVRTICLDKTGTITENRMTVKALYVDMRRLSLTDIPFASGATEHPNEVNASIDRLCHVCALCNETKVTGKTPEGRCTLFGSPTETALMHLAIQYGIDLESINGHYRTRKLNHRSETRLFMSTLHETPDHRYVLSVKGNPTEVLARCDRQMIDGRVAFLDAQSIHTIESENEKMAFEAMRVMGFAYKATESLRDAEFERNLIWVGMVEMVDPIREGVRELMRIFHRAGVKTVMITGDQSGTAHAVAREIDISDGHPLKILDSTELTVLDPETLRALAATAHVYARVSPSHKLRIVQALQASGETVAMTGDGINDSPALKAADIGIAMGRSGTEVARDVADVILREDNLETLTVALKDGRTTYDNIRKSVHFFLSTNISEILLMFSAMALGIGFPLNVMQLLWINIISDIFPGLALSMEPPEPNVMEREPRDASAPLLSKNDFKKMTMESAAITGGALAAYGIGIARYGMGARAGTLAFHSLTVGQLLHALSCRSESRPAWTKQGLPRNKYLEAAVGGSILMQLLAAVLPAMRRLLGLTPINLFDAALIGVTSVLPLMLNETLKKDSQ